MKAIYKLTNLEDGRVYVGQTNNLDIRKNRHFYDLKKNKHHNKFLQNSYNKYGEENFIFECVEITDNLDERELYWINMYGGINSESNYNLKDPLTSDFSDYLKVEIKKSSSGENNPNYGNKWSEEQKEKLSKERKGLTLEERVGKEKSDLAKEKMSKTRTGRKHTEEHKNKIREANLGENNPNYGKGYRQVGEKNPMWNKPSKGRKAIQQFTKDGEFVKEYEYITQVKEDGFNIGNVSYVANGKSKTAGGFIWRFKENNNVSDEKIYKPNINKKHTEEHKNNMREANLGEKNPAYGKGYRQVGDKNPMWGKQSKNRTPIQQFTKDGEFVKEYECIAQVKEDGFGPSNVMYCAKGMKNYKTAGGFIWKFKE